MRYLSFVRSSESFRNSQPPAALMQAMEQHMAKSFANGSLISTGGLLPSKDGLRVRLANGNLTVTDGPFTESKEVIGGWAILEAASKEEAQRLACEFMALHHEHWPEFEGECEVRPIFDPDAACV